ncbi:MAG: hypothetical protein ACE5OV_00930 [Candidatus Bathyarchaeia archaeon]
MDVLRIIVNVISLTINIGLAYFAVRLMQIFEGGKMKKPWRFMSMGVLTLAVGSSLFSLYYMLALPSYVHPIGAFVAMIGGGLVLVGLRAEYKLWTRTE